ncbi:MAG: hypothetical protein MUD14_02155 [Hydrococcus sp. Prado102]|nr:hypothetical protein [Hydrococcus sp. Prado102]
MSFLILQRSTLPLPRNAIAFILLYIVATVAFLPESFLTLDADAIFGIDLLL